MRSFPKGLPALAAAALFLGAAVTAHAQPFNHEQCYKIKDPVKLEAFADMDVPQYALELGCKIGKAKFFCAPAEKSLISATDKATGLPIAPLPIYGGPDGTVRPHLLQDEVSEPVVAARSPRHRPVRNPHAHEVQDQDDLHAGGEGWRILRQRRHRSGRGLRRAGARRVSRDAASPIAPARARRRVATSSFRRHRRRRRVRPNASSTPARRGRWRRSWRAARSAVLRSACRVACRLVRRPIQQCDSRSLRPVSGPDHRDPVHRRSARSRERPLHPARLELSVTVEANGRAASLAAT